MPILPALQEIKTIHCDIGKRWNGSAESQNLSMRRNLHRENREPLAASNDGQQPLLAKLPKSGRLGNRGKRSCILIGDGLEGKVTNLAMEQERMNRNLGRLVSFVIQFSIP